MQKFLGLRNKLNSFNGWQRLFLLAACIYAIFLCVDFKAPEDELSFSAAVSQNLPTLDGTHYMAIVLSEGKGIRLGEQRRFIYSDYDDRIIFLMPDGVSIKTEKALTQAQVQDAYQNAQIDQKYRYLKNLLFALGDSIAKWFIFLGAIYLLGLFLGWIYKGFRKS